VGAKIGARLAIYKVWERKLELVCYLQSVGAKTGA